MELIDTVFFAGWFAAFVGLIAYSAKVQGRAANSGRRMREAIADAEARARRDYAAWVSEARAAHSAP